MADHAIALRGPAGEPVEYADRGTLTIREKVVAKIARRAACEVGGVVQHSSGLGILGSRSLPSVDVEVADGQVRARVELAVAWPRPVRTVAAGVRDHLRSELVRYTGLGVDSVDVTVAAVLTPDQVPAPKRRLR